TVACPLHPTPLPRHSSPTRRSSDLTTEPAPFAPGAGAPTLPSPAPAPVSCRSTAHGAKAESNHNPRARPHSHPGRVLLPSGLLRQPRFHVGAPPTVRKRSQTPTTEPTPFAPGAGAPTTN